MSAILKLENSDAPAGLAILRDVVRGSSDTRIRRASPGRKSETSVLRVVSLPADILEQA